jgi:hypothetical protein
LVLSNKSNREIFLDKALEIVAKQFPMLTPELGADLIVGGIARMVSGESVPSIIMTLTAYDLGIPSDSDGIVKYLYKKV